MTTTNDHVSSFLAPIDTPYTVKDAAEYFLDRMAQDSKIGEAIVALTRQYEAKPLIGSEHARIFERLRQAGTDTFDMPDIPDFVQPMVAAGYLRLKADLQSPIVRRKMNKLGAHDITRGSSP